MSHGNDVSMINVSGPADGSTGSQPPPARSNCIFSCLLALAILYTLYFDRDFFLPVFIAFFLALVSLPLANQLARWRVPHGVSAGYELDGP